MQLGIPFEYDITKSSEWLQMPQQTPIPDDKFLPRMLISYTISLIIIQRILIQW